MSNWTHVAGVVRLDFINVFNRQLPDFDKMFGKECLFESAGDVWRDTHANPDSYLPMGSEGSLQKSVWINPNKSHIAAFTVTIFGDLRDHDSAEEIIEWFKKKCEEVCAHHCFVRNAVITAENEVNGTMTWVYEEEEE